MLILKSSSLSSIFLFLYILMGMPFMLYMYSYSYSMLLEWSLSKSSSLSFSFSIILDSVSLSFSLLVCFISLCVMIFSSSYMGHEVFLPRFIWLVMLFVLSMNFLIFIPSLPALLLGWDGLGIISFLLVIYYQNPKSLSAGMLTIMANRIGDVMVIISVSVLVLQGHWIIMIMWDFSLQVYFLFMILVAGMTKSAQIPFSSWLPAAMAAPTPVSALVHSSTLVTAGVFLLVRFYEFFSLFNVFFETLLFFSVLTLLMAGISANFENDLKKIIALSTLSQLGVMMVSLAMCMPYLALYHLYTHAMFKALLFLCAGALIHNNLNAQDIRKMGQMFLQAPLTITCLNIANFSLCGMPFLSGFYSKDLILEVSLSSSGSLLMILMIFFATGATISYSLRLSLCSLWAPFKLCSYHCKMENDMYINVPTVLLSLAAVMAGWFGPLISMKFYYSAHLPLIYKLLPLGCIFVGALVSVGMWLPKLMGITSFVKMFFSSMWFMSLVSSQPASKKAMLYGQALAKSVDQGWMEILGGQGIFFLLKSNAAILSANQMKSFNFFIFLVIFSFLLMGWGVL